MKQTMNLDIDLETMSPAEVAKFPRTAMGDIVVDEFVTESGVTIQTIWNEIDHYRTLLECEDFEWLQARLRNLLPNVPVKTVDWSKRN